MFFFNDLEIMNRKFNTRQTDDFVNLTQYLLIFSQRKKSRTHSCLHNGKNRLANESSWKFTVRLWQSSFGWLMVNSVFNFDICQHFHYYDRELDALQSIRIEKPLSPSTSSTYIHSVYTLFQTRKKNTDLKLVLKSAQFFRPS